MQDDMAWVRRIKVCGGWGGRVLGQNDVGGRLPGRGKGKHGLDHIAISMIIGKKRKFIKVSSLTGRCDYPRNSCNNRYIYGVAVGAWWWLCGGGGGDGHCIREGWESEQEIHLKCYPVHQNESSLRWWQSKYEQKILSKYLTVKNINCCYTALGMVGEVVRMAKPLELSIRLDIEGEWNSEVKGA